MATFVRQYHFPPFPAIPEGVKIIPFKDFKEYGARVVGADGVERDGLGIATIALPRKVEKQVAPQNGVPLRKEWWEQWNTSGQPIRGLYDPKMNRVDRFYQASTEFSKHYKIYSHHQHLQILWNTFRLFTGLTAMEGSKSTQGADQELSDDDDEPEETTFVKPATETDPNRLPVSQLNTTTVQSQTEEKILAFLNDPAQSITIFLSSYMYEHGQMWDQRKLISAPHLMRFFVHFLLVNTVLHENVQGLQDAYKAIDLAQKELPLTWNISEVLPDAFSMACQGHWGQKASGFVSWDPDSDSDGEPDAKRAKLNHNRDMDTEPSAAAIQEVDDGAPTTNGSGGWGAGGDSGWGASSSWGASAEKIQTGNAQDVDMPANTDGGWDAGSGWGDAAWGPSDTTANDPPAPAAVIVPQLPPRPTLLKLFGPTALPVTHAPGIVEWSLRRIKSVSAPPSEVPPADGAAAVERGLEARMHRMVLEPWVGPNAAADVPHVLRSSKGAVAPAVAGSPDQPKPHDVLKDEITVLVEAGAAKMLSVGMGLIGTWVQMARVQDQEGGENQVTDAVPEKKKSLTKGQKARRGLRYWYIDELVLVVPSYWAV
ncbi:hypothetical protein C8R45DRAFT_1212606 [Mycena sanguinolenta]|nr:hypothetical protein C8R45DRAFT_1212606 [Mycena sanguinolenta]